MIDFKIKQSYSFDVYPAALLGNNFKNVTVLGELDYELANRDASIEALHVNVYPYLPAGTPRDPRDYSYVYLRLANGETTVLGLPWIRENTVVQVNSTVIVAKISGVTPQDMAKVRDALTENGFGQLDISIQ